MAATDFYAGQAVRFSITHKDSTGTAIPHVSLEEVRYILRHENGETLLRYKKTAPSGWKALTTEADAGKYTLEIEEKESKTWTEGLVVLEWFIKVTDADYVDGYKPMGFYELYNVKETNYAKE